MRLLSKPYWGEGDFVRVRAATLGDGRGAGEGRGLAAPKGVSSSGPRLDERGIDARNLVKLGVPKGLRLHAVQVGL